MKPKRVAAFFDGFNLYHAIDRLKQPHLKWLDLWNLAEQYTRSADLELSAVYYFSAYAKWRTQPWARHRSYVRALRARGVTPVLGEFKTRPRRCPECTHRWVTHEEKQTDVNIGLYLLNEARKDTYDRALLFSADSDLTPAVRMLKVEFPGKEIRVVTPVGLRHAMAFVKVAGFRAIKAMKPIHAERSLLPAEVLDSEGNQAVKRPAQYDPPVSS